MSKRSNCKKPKCQNVRTAKSPNVKTVELQKARTYGQGRKVTPRFLLRARNMFFALSSEMDRVETENGSPWTAKAVRQSSPGPPFPQKDRQKRILQKQMISEQKDFSVQILVSRK